MKRIFIAIKINPGKGFLKIFSSLKSGLEGERINWVPEANIHITLVFLGEIEDKRVNDVASVLEKRCSGFGSFLMKISGTGVFRSMDDPRVIWANISDPDRIAELAESLSSGLADSGFKVEARPFKAHLTLGRIKFIRNIEKLKGVLKEHRDSFYQDASVTEVILYESILKTKGPEYHPLKKYPLG